MARDRVYARAGVRDGRGDDGGRARRSEDEDEDADEDEPGDGLFDETIALERRARVRRGRRRCRAIVTQRGDAGTWGRERGFTVAHARARFEISSTPSLRDAFGGLTSASDYSAVSREGRTAVMYGTSREVDDAREIEVAFIHPWDGDASRVAAWLANRAASDDAVVSPVGWARATASLGVSLFPDVVRAYKDAVRVRKAHAASVFMAVDVVASARGPAPPRWSVTT